MMLFRALLRTALYSWTPKPDACCKEQWGNAAITKQSAKFMMTHQGHTEKNTGEINGPQTNEVTLTNSMKLGEAILCLLLCFQAKSTQLV